MEKRKLILANWKMNLTVSESLQVAMETESLLPHPMPAKAELVFAPCYPALWPMKNLCETCGFGLSAQDVFQESSGPYGSAVSAPMLKELCEYVVIGHSDRRIRFGDTDEIVNRKVLQAVAAGLKPVVCIGETLQARNLGLAESSLDSQLRYALAGVHDISSVTVLYEPVWALGSGKSLDGEGAADIAFFLRRTLSNLYGSSEANHARIIYAGSVSPENVHDFACRDAIDGVALGSSALKAEKIAKIVTAFI